MLHRHTGGGPGSGLPPPSATLGRERQGTSTVPCPAQVMSTADVSKPSYQLASQARLLVLKLHDGKLGETGAAAAAYRHIGMPPPSASAGCLAHTACQLRRGREDARQRLGPTYGPCNETATHYPRSCQGCGVAPRYCRAERCDTTRHQGASGPCKRLSHHWGEPKAV